MKVIFHSSFNTITITLQLNWMINVMFNSQFNTLVFRYRTLACYRPKCVLCVTLWHSSRCLDRFDCVDGVLEYLFKLSPFLLKLRTAACRKICLLGIRRILRLVICRRLDVRRELLISESFFVYVLYRCIAVWPFIVQSVVKCKLPYRNILAVVQRMTSYVRITPVL